MSLLTYLKRLVLYIKNGPTITKHITADIHYISATDKLKGKRIIITGGGRGLGLAMAKKFMAEGAEVLIAGRNEETLAEKAAELNCKYLKLDVQNCEEFDNFIKQAHEMLGSINCLVNNAGISLHEGEIINVTEEQFDSQISTNLKGGYFLSQKFIKYFENSKQKFGNILFVSSERGFFTDDLPYGLTKVAINSLVKGLAYRVARKNIRVNGIAPGVTTSDMTGFKANENLHAPWNTNERVYLPEEVAEVASFLLSDAANCLSGQILECNNGKTANAHWK